MDSNNNESSNIPPKDTLNTNGYNPNIKKEIEQASKPVDETKRRNPIDNPVATDNIPSQNNLRNPQPYQNDLTNPEGIGSNPNTKQENTQNELDNKSSIMPKNKANNNIPGYNVNQNHAPQKSNPNKQTQSKPNVNGFNNNKIRNFLNNKNKKNNSQSNGEKKEASEEKAKTPKPTPTQTGVGNALNTINNLKQINEEGASQLLKQKAKLKITAMILKALPVILPVVGIVAIIILLVIIILAVVMAIFSNDDVNVQAIDVNYCTSVNLKWGESETEETTLTDDEYIAYELSNSIVSNIDNSSVIQAMAVVYRTNLYANTENIQDNVCTVKTDKKYVEPTDAKYLENVQSTLRLVYTFDRNELKELPITDYFSYKNITKNTSGEDVYNTYIDSYHYPKAWVDDNVPKEYLVNDSSISYGFSPYMAEYLAINEKNNFHDLLYHFYSYDPQSLDMAYKIGGIYKIVPEENTYNNGSNFSSSCSSISLTTTSLSESEFVTKMQAQASSDSSHASFYNQAAYIYNVAVSNNINPELVVLRAKAEGFSPGGSTNNYWGLGCSNGTSNCISYSTFTQGLLGFINNISKYSNVQSMMSKYAYIGKYWYNGDYTSSSLGGCYYYSYIKQYMSPDRAKEVEDACYNSPNMCSKSGGSGCLATNTEDQQAYSMWQVSNMANLGSGIFGTVSNDCTDDSGNTGGSNSSGSCTIYAQGDSRWGSTKLGSSSTNMSRSGCAVTSIAIGISCSGVTLTDSNFNAGSLVNALNSAGCIDSSGSVSWSCPAITKIAPGLTFKQSISLKGLTAMDKITKVKQANTSNSFVILHISNSEHSTHFVVYSKSSGTNFIVKDPAGGKMSTYNANDIDSIRVYTY